jgi:hypothetical protein
METVDRYKEIAKMRRTEEGDVTCLDKVKAADPIPAHAETWSWVAVSVECS